MLAVNLLEAYIGQTGVEKSHWGSEAGTRANMGPNQQETMAKLFSSNHYVALILEEENQVITADDPYQL